MDGGRAEAGGARMGGGAPQRRAGPGGMRSRREVVDGVGERRSADGATTTLMWQNTGWMPDVDYRSLRPLSHGGMVLHRHCLGVAAADHQH